MDFQDVMRSRRAVNFFDPDRDVPPEDLDKILETATRAPSGFNLQPWKVAVLREPAQKAKLRALAWDQPKVTEAPVILMFLADTEAWKTYSPSFERQFSYLVETGQRKPEDREAFAKAVASLYGETPEKSLAFAVKNTAFFAMTVMYAAADLGYATHPMDGFDHDGVRGAFSIPDTFWIPLLMAVGHLKPGTAVAPPKWRFDVDDITYTLPD
ncbi:nitroreductase [Solidesulfovibrio fructosivorans JJ]]|uniref:Nitroreductase n=1 Tax=Solidesulfovibrio fructosivorans JJ] TaxID=596151 RepID=E1K1N1_SOLFR|nr:nitroreductase family protein [Solidesulfovibrio fructosivorans]EFL49469.1 nitroreductase [Solidesulfovibrio fructosivorans JJ]]